ncbi:MAG: CcdB family protein [Pseudomonadota bacterium]
MAQFDVYENPDATGKDDIPFLLDVQSDLLDALVTRVVVPLVAKRTAGQPAARLNPQFRIRNMAVVMSTPELAGIPKTRLSKKITNLAAKRDEIIGALDIVFTGI